MIHKEFFKRQQLYTKSHVYRSHEQQDVDECIERKDFEWSLFNAHFDRHKPQQYEEFQQLGHSALLIHNFNFHKQNLNYMKFQNDGKLITQLFWILIE